MISLVPTAIPAIFSKLILFMGGQASLVAFVKSLFCKSNKASVQPFTAQIASANDDVAVRHARVKSHVHAQGGGL